VTSGSRPAVSVYRPKRADTGNYRPLCLTFRLDHPEVCLLGHRLIEQAEFVSPSHLPPRKSAIGDTAGSTYHRKRMMHRGPCMYKIISVLEECLHAWPASLPYRSASRPNMCSAWRGTEEIACSFDSLVLGLASLPIRAGFTSAANANSRGAKLVCPIRERLHLELPRLSSSHCPDFS